MQEVIAGAIRELFGLTVEPQLSRPDPRFGDYATNIVLQLAKPLKKAPIAIAEELATVLRATPECEEVSVAGPGFINIRLSNQALLALVGQEPSRTREGMLVVIETNNPNPFKPMHIGHAYNAILADTMANLVAVSGAEVKRVSYHGDVGAHVGKSMWALLRYCDGDPEALNAIAPDARNEFMGKMYAEGARAAKESDVAAAEIRALAEQSFYREDPLYATIYDTVMAWSFAEIDRTVARLGNVPTERRYLESEADAIGVATVREATPAVFEESEGALIFKGSKHGSFDNAFVGSNGRGLYAARDLGLIQLKLRDYPTLDEAIIVTGAEQAAYFKGVIAAAGLALPTVAGKLKNYPTGLVKLSSGKMSSRTGEVITIGWLFDEFARAIRARGGKPEDTIVAGALRYQFLKVKIGGDVIFDINEAVSLTGNTGSYLQYAHARARSVLEKLSVAPTPLRDVRDEDRALVAKLGEYHEVVSLATAQLEPHHLCTYLFELAQEFNRYYEKHRVVGGDDEAHRGGVVAAYADTLQAGLAILGIVAPTRL